MIKDIIWNIKSFLAQPIVPTVPMSYVLQNNGSWTSNNATTDKYVYYWIGDFNTGKQVKVKAIDVLRYENMKLQTELDMKEVID